MSLEVTDLVAGYGATTVLDGVSLEVAERERVCVLGTNGVGKTTLLSALAGVIPSRSGTIRWQGDDITHVSAHQRVRLGMVLCPQGRELFSGMSVRENLMLGARAAGHTLKLASTTLASVLATFPELEPRLQQRAGSMSGGQQQMVAIGRALMARPTLLMLDEPSLGLAPMAILRMFEATRQINLEGVSLLLVEQNVKITLAESDRGLVISGGTVAAEGEAASLVKDPIVEALYLG